MHSKESTSARQDISLSALSTDSCTENKKSEWRVTVLSDNRDPNNRFETEHGLCIYLETNKYKCLFDTGASDLFIRNAVKLGIDLAQVDYVFISHGHADHIGGLPAFLAINSTATVVLSPQAVNQSFYSKRTGFRKISIDFEPENYPNRFVLVDKSTEIEDDIQVLCCSEAPASMPIANNTLYKMQAEELKLDNFDHEIIVCLGRNEKLIYSGCAHKGLVNILNTTTQALKQSISAVIGGFHLHDAHDEQTFETENDLNEIAQYLNSHYPTTRFITGHCTGQKAYDVLNRLMNKRLEQFYAGYSNILNNSNK